MKDLLSFYNDELVFFRQHARLYAEKYPKTAGRLMGPAGVAEDPHVERLIQAFALLTARVAKRLDSDYPKFTESLLEGLYPHYLRPVPSCSIVQFGRRDRGGTHSVTTTFARGCVLQSEPVQGVQCQFSSVYDVTVAPVSIARAAFAPLIQAPGALRLPDQAIAAIAITFDILDDGMVLASGALPRMRVHIDGESSMRAMLIDALMMHACGAYVQVGDSPQWQPLNRVPLRLAGLDEDDAMIPFSERSHPSFRLLTEYFAFPEKFNFIDIDLRELTRLIPSASRQFTLHLALSGISPNSTAARALSALSPKNFLLGCTPIINLFPRTGVPVQLRYTAADYPLLADAARPFGYEVYRVNAVSLGRESANGTSTVSEFSPLYGAHNGDNDTDDDGSYWLIRRNEAVATISPGHETRIALIDPHFKASGTATVTLSTELLCTNRDLPCQLAFGSAAGDLNADEVPTGLPVRLLRQPSPPYRFNLGKDGHLRLIAHLSLNYSALTNAGLEEFRQMLALYDLADSLAVQRIVKGVVGLEHGTVRAWIPTEPVASLMPGIGIRMTVDEEAFVGSSLYVFAQVMDRYFALNSQLNCYTQLELVSQRTGEEILTCQPRSAEKTKA